MRSGPLSLAGTHFYDARKRAYYTRISADEDRVDLMAAQTLFPTFDEPSRFEGLLAKAIPKPPPAEKKPELSAPAPKPNLVEKNQCAELL